MEESGESSGACSLNIIGKRSVSKEHLLCRWEMRCLCFMPGPIIICPQQIGVAKSSDGIHWTKLSNKPFLMNGDPGTWNCCESGHPHLFKTRKGKTYLFYQGNDDFGKTWFLSNMEVKWKNRHPFIAHYINQKAH